MQSRSVLNLRFPCGLGLSQHPVSHEAQAQAKLIFGLATTVVLLLCQDYFYMQSSLYSLGQQRSLSDVSISGVPGWVAISAGARGRIAVRVWTLKGVQAYVRAPLPCLNPAVQATDL